jgi:putative membrane protein
VTSSRSRALAPVAGVALALSLVASGVAVVVAPAGSASSDASFVNDEVVLATLDPSGLPQDARLVSTVTTRGGQARTVEDPASTTNVVYLDRRGTPRTGTDVVLVDVGGTGTTSVITQATFDKPLPVALHAEYAVDGEVVAPEAVVGASGLLSVRYTVTNTTAQQQTITYRDAAGEVRTRTVPVFVPFAGTLTVVLPPSLEVVDTGTATRTTDASGRTVLRYTLALAPPLGTFQQQAVLRARTDDGATPAATLEVAPATSETDPGTGVTRDALAGSVRGSLRLADGLATLSDEAGRLAGGAQQVADGTDQLASGAAVLADQVTGALLEGSRELAVGGEQLAAGAEELAGGLQQAEPGAQQLASGADDLAVGVAALATGLQQLADGLAAAAAGAGTLTQGANGVADALGSASDPPWPPPGVLPPFPVPPDLTLEEIAALTPEQLAALLADYGDQLRDYAEALRDLADLPANVPPPTVVQSLRLLQTLTAALVHVGRDVQGLLLVTAKRSAGAAALDAADLVTQLCGPTPTLTADQCRQLTSVAADAGLAAAAATAAVGVNAVLFGIEQKPRLGAVPALGEALGRLEQGVLAISAAVRSGDPRRPGLVEGLAALQGGVRDARRASAALAGGAATAAQGARQLAGGADALAAGVGAAASGASELARGAQRLAAGQQAQADGVERLGEGALALAGGASQAAAGSAAVAAGVTAVQVQGIDRIGESVVEASREPALARAWLAATDRRAADALPYGAPEGALGTVSYRLTMASLRDTGTPAWQWWALAVVGLAAVGWGVRTRLASSPPPS